MTSENSLYKDLIDMKARNNHSVSVFKLYWFVLVSLLIELHCNFKFVVSIFFSKFKLLNWGCGLSTGAAYTRAAKTLNWDYLEQPQLVFGE